MPYQFLVWEIFKVTSISLNICVYIVLELFHLSLNLNDSQVYSVSNVQGAGATKILVSREIENFRDRESGACAQDRNNGDDL